MNVFKDGTPEYHAIGIPNDYDFLINDPEFETLVAEAINGRIYFLRDFWNTILHSERCIEEIDNYLKDEMD